jgi:hypothetical protein
LKRLGYREAADPDATRLDEAAPLDWYKQLHVQLLALVTALQGE